MNFADLVATAPRIPLGGDSPRILSENHNGNSINWVAGMSDPGEMIACGAYQELRRLNGESDTDYAARLVPLIAALPEEHRKRIQAAGIQAATGRANLATRNGRVAVMVAGKAPWHGLGVNVADAVGGKHVLALSSTDFEVEKRPLYYRHNGADVASKSAWEIVRSDTGVGLGSVGSKYKTFQNREVVALADAVIGEFGARFETAGALGMGESVWYQVALPKQSFSLFNGKVQNESSALFSNCHDGSGVMNVVPTSENVVCGNTHRVALNKARGKGIGIRHTGDIQAKIGECRKALGIVVKGFEGYAETADALSRSKLGNETQYFGSVLDEVLEATAADLAKGREAWARSEADVLASMIGSEQAKYLETRRTVYDDLIEQRTTLLDDMLTRYAGEKCGVGGQRGTVWSGYMAVTESADHGLLGGRRQGTDRKREETRFASVTVGRADDVKQIAYRSAKALAV